MMWYGDNENYAYHVCNFVCTRVIEAVISELLLFIGFASNINYLVAVLSVTLIIFALCWKVHFVYYSYFVQICFHLLK